MLIIFSKKKKVSLKKTRKGEFVITVEGMEFNIYTLQ